MNSTGGTETDLIDLTRAEDFTTDRQFLECFVESQRERDLIDKLKGPGAHLLEGPRGVGKSSLLKKAELELDDEFSENRVLGVYVNFKASLLVESASEDLDFDPFLCWVMAKLIGAFHKKVRKLQWLTSGVIREKYARVLGISTNVRYDAIEEIVRDLQNLATASSHKRQELVRNLAENEVSQITINMEGAANFISQVLNDHDVPRVNFLFDEAAHTFDEHQQERFFSFFKLLHGGPVALKAATYPGVTAYGRNFEDGQDAIRLNFSSTKENSEASRDQLRKQFRSLLGKRVSPRKFGTLVRRGEALDLLVLLSNGNPRAFLQSVSKWSDSGEYSKRSALAASNDYVSTELVNYHMGLKRRLPRFSSHIELGMALIKGHIVPELQFKNEGKGDDPKVQTVYFTIESIIPQKILRAIELLEYSGFIFAKSVVKTAGRKQASRYALHLGVAANEKVFHSKFSRDPDLAIKKLSLTDYREFYASDPRFQQLKEDYPSTETCPNGHLRETDGRFCPTCGEKFGISNVILDLLNDSVDYLFLTEFLKNSLKGSLEAHTVGEVMELTESDIKQAWMIGDVRAKLILNAAEEYISG